MAAPAGVTAERALLDLVLLGTALAAACGVPIGLAIALAAQFASRRARRAPTDPAAQEERGEE